MQQGRVVEQGSVLDLFARPQHPVSASFVQSVLHDRLPQQVLDYLQQTPQKPALRLEFAGASAQQPVINRIIRDHAIEVNILFASMADVQQTLLGFMIVQIDGDAQAVARATGDLRASGVTISHV